MSKYLYLMIQNLMTRVMFALILISPAFALAPVIAEASTSSSTITTVADTASIDSSSLYTDSGNKRIYLSGESSASKIRITITTSDTDRSLYKSKTISVHGGNWHLSASKRLPDGTYTATVYSYIKGKSTLLTKATFYVGVKPVTLKVAPIALLSGGTTASGTTVPISYLQIVNQSNATTTIAGFWVKQNGSAPVSTIIGFSSVDDKGNNRMSVGGTEGQTPFVGGQAYVPSGAILGPHQMKLFTIKVQLSANARANAGKTLMLDVTGLDAAAGFSTTFPVRGTTWVISG